MDTLPTPGPVGTPNQPTPPSPPPSGQLPEERTLAMAAHLASLVQYVGIPFGNILGPLIVWLVKKDSMPFVDVNGKEALNFNISVALYMLISTALVFILIGIPMLAAVAVFHIVFTIIAAVRANRGEAYQYPLTIRLIK